MGVSSSKSVEGRHPELSQTEYSGLKSLYETDCEKYGQLTEKNLQNIWNGLIEDSLLTLFIKYLCKNETFVDFETFIRPYVTIMHGSNEEKTQFLCAFLTGNENSKEVPIKAITEYVQSIISSYLLQMKTSNNKQFLSWSGEKFYPRDKDVKLFADYLCRDISKKPETISFDELEKWRYSWSRIAAMEKFVFKTLYSVGPDEIEEDRVVKLIPYCVMLPRLTCHASILKLSDVIYLNSSLPIDLRDQWRLLFSVHVHGFSFSKLMDCITNKGPTLIITEDDGGHVFGGFATENWKLGPSFCGDERSFLFTLRPEINMYFSSGYNEHYQYMNLKQQTFPNGLGMGGQIEYFGFWLDAEFGKGHSSETCTTYKNYKMLSSSKQFKVNHVEVWGVGPEPKNDDEGVRKSVLDANLEDHALLEMVGKSYHSDGYRDPIEEED
ncbi:MTOR-associated protein MEAK7 isoform X2 [Anabrus simplex]|uniref:MTOR-associated protein MEAK7 isoform X2 n=1 Tax=Anabrus simplex TaxID=316456 RepID=UPI0035A34B95